MSGSRTAHIGKGDVFHVPFKARKVRVLSGKAWLSVAGRDVILRSGDLVDLSPSRYDPLITTLGDSPVIVETL